LKKLGENEVLHSILSKPFLPPVFHLATKLLQWGILPAGYLFWHGARSRCPCCDCL